MSFSYSIYVPKNSGGGSGPGNVSEAASSTFNIAGGGSFMFNSGLANISDVSVYQGTDDITSGVEIDVSGGVVTISSNNAITGLIVRVTGV